MIDYICDTTPIKQGKLSPGVHIPIVPYETFKKNPPDYAILLAWNHAEEIMEKEKEYVTAAKMIGLTRQQIMLRHILPNVLSPVLVIATITFALAIIAEATLSFLGVGVPSTKPSLGTLIRIGQDFLFSGEWWILLFPAVTLLALALSINLFGDWLRDILNPKLK